MSGEPTDPFDPFRVDGVLPESCDYCWERHCNIHSRVVSALTEAFSSKEAEIAELRSQLQTAQAELKDMAERLTKYEKEADRG